MVMDSRNMRAMLHNSIHTYFQAFYSIKCWERGIMHNGAPSKVQCGHRIAHRKWIETKQQPGKVGPGNMIAVAQFLSICCGPSCIRTRYILNLSPPKPALRPSCWTRRPLFEPEEASPAASPSTATTCCRVLPRASNAETDKV